MIIEYLQALRDNPTIGDDTIDGLNLSEIQDLEQLYNNGNPFPKILKELLFLAGKSCPWLDRKGLNQQEVQDELIIFAEVYGVSISRPHYVIDLSSSDKPLFIYLDEGDNPILYQMLSRPTPSNYSDNGFEGQRTIKFVIEARIQDYKDGYGAF